ncbi:MAG: hypothetical protein V1793_14750 [Pseudomonadota bacterium]
MFCFKRFILALSSVMLLFYGSVSASPYVNLDPNWLMQDPGTISKFDPNMIFPAGSTGPVQQIIIPYATMSNGWACGLSIHNPSSSTVYYQAGFYDSTGTYKSGITFSIPKFGSKTDALGSFANGVLNGTISVYLRTLNENLPFAATLFVGSSDAFMGFGFQSFTSLEKTLTLVDDPTP